MSSSLHEDSGEDHYHIHQSRMTVVSFSSDSKESSDTEDPRHNIQVRKKRKYCKLIRSQMVHVNNISSDPYKVRLPKIPSSDIRRMYPLMFLNTMNLMDVSVMRSFFERCTHPDSVLKRQIMSRDGLGRELERLSFYGSQDMFSYSFVLAMLCPDRVLQLTRDPIIITRSDNYRTEIVLEGDTYATWPYDTDPVKAGHYLLSLLNRTQSQLREESADSAISSLERMFKQHHLRLAKCPIKVKISGKITLVINNIHERAELDEINIASYGLFDTAEPKRIEDFT